MIKEKRLAYAAWIAVCFFWGTGYLATRIGVQNMPPMLFSGLRIFAAGLILTVILILRRERLPRGSEWAHLSVIGIALEGVSNGILAWSAQWVTSSMMALLAAMTPFWMVGIEAMIPGGEKLTPRIIFGLLLGFGGLIWLLKPELKGFSLDSKFLIGCLSIQLVCISYGAGSIYSRRVRLSTRSMMSAGIQMLFAGVILLLIGTIWNEWSRLYFNASSLSAILYLLIFGSIIGYSSYIYSLQKLPVSLVSLHRYINPVVAILLGWIILGEKLSANTIIGVIIIASGVILVQKK